MHHLTHVLSLEELDHVGELERGLAQAIEGLDKEEGIRKWWLLTACLLALFVGVYSVFRGCVRSRLAYSSINATPHSAVASRRPPWLSGTCT